MKSASSDTIACDENSQTKDSTPKILFGWEDVAIAVAEAIVQNLATQAWDRVQGNGTQDVLSDTINGLYQRFQDATNQARIGSALSRYGNAKLEVNNYRNDPDHRPNTLDFAENEVGYAMLELEQMGLFALHSWLISAELYMAILQERLKITGSPGAQENINNHYNYMANYYKSIDEQFRRDFHYCWITNFGLVYCGMESVHIPDQAELDAQQYVGTSHAVLDKMKSIIKLELLDSKDPISKLPTLTACSSCSASASGVNEVPISASASSVLSRASLFVGGMGVSSSSSSSSSQNLSEPAKTSPTPAPR